MPDDDQLRRYLAGGSVLRGVSSDRRTRDAADLAAMRPAAPPRPRRRRVPQTPAPPAVPAASGVVFAGIACFCGQRFGPDEAAGFMLHLRAEVGDDLQMLASVRRWRQATASRPEYRARQAAARRKKRAALAAARAAAAPPVPAPAPVICACGCGERTRGRGRFRPGHHMRLRGSTMAGRPARDQADKDRAAALYAAGTPAREIAAAMGVHPTTVQRWIGPAVRRPGPAADPERDAEILRLRDAERQPYRVIAESVGMSKTGARMRYYELTGRGR